MVRLTDRPDMTLDVYNNATTVTFVNRKNSFLGLSEPEKMLNFLIFSYL